MRGPSGSDRFYPKNYAASATIPLQDLVHYGQFITATGSLTFTIPSPISGLVGREIEFINNSSGNMTVSCTSGFLASVNTYVIGTKDNLSLQCVETTPGTYKWVPLAVAGTFSATTLASTAHAASAKTPPIAADEFVVIDSAASWGLKKATGTQLKVLTAETTQTVGSLIAAAGAKAVPVDADLVGVADTETGNILTKTTWTQVKAFLKTYFDTIYPATTATAVATFSPTIAFAGGSAATVTAEVYRQQTVNKMCKWVADIAGSDGGGNTTLTVTFPAALIPTDVNLLSPVKAQVSIGGGAYANVLATLDCADATPANRKLTVATGSLTDDAAFRIILSGEHEIA